MLVFSSFALWLQTVVNLYLSLLFFALGLLVLKEENQDLNEIEQTDQYENRHEFLTGEKPTQTKTTSIRKRAQKNQI